MQRPNILLIYTDQWRWDALGANGNPHIHTPNLDKLAAEGVNFDHYFVQNPVCMPSRVSFLTGQYPSKLGITHMAVPVPQDTITLPRMLKPYGYHTANIGKLHFLPHANRDHRNPYPDYGFDHMEISDEPGVYADAYRAWVERLAPDQLDHLSVGLPPATHTWQQTMGIEDGITHRGEGGRFDFKEGIPFGGKDEYTFSAFVAAQTNEYLKSQDGRRPFLCISSFYSPHAPWVVPQKYLDLYDPDTLPIPDYPDDVERPAEGVYSDSQLRAAKQGYYAMISEVDHYVGEILATLDAQGLAENTIVLFTSDHGEWLGDHLRYGKGYPGDDPVSRVPCILRVPDAAPRTVHDVVEAVDVLPTLLHYAGIQVPPHVQGQSLKPLIEGASRDNAALMEFTGWKTLRTARFRYLIQADGTEMMWDIESDPGEHKDVARNPAYAAALAEHRRLLVQKLLMIERPLPRTWPY